MGRAPCCSKVGLHRGPWTPKEDALLTKYIHAHGEGQWRSLPKRAGLLRCGKSCRLRWMNYLRPDIKRGNISAEEDDLIIRMHSLLGNRWSLIAGRLPGRTDNEIKNYWNTHLSKRLKTTTTTQPPLPHKNKKKMKKKKQAKNKNNNNNNNNNVEEILLMEEEEELLEEKKTNIYLPKPIRVKAMSIQRNYNTTESTTTLSLDSNNNGGSNSSSASGSSSQLEKEESPSELLHIKEVINYNLINWEDVENYDDFGIFIEEDQDQDHHNIDIVNNSNNNNNASIVLSEEEENNDNNMGCHSLEKLYEEYFQLLKDTNNNANHCDQNQGELDSFAQSLFV